MFGNEAKRNAKKMTVEQWILWSAEVRLSSNEAAIAGATAQRAGHDQIAIGLRLFDAARNGAAQEALTYYPKAAVKRAYSDEQVSHLIVDLLRHTQVPFVGDAEIAEIHRLVSGEPSDEERTLFETFLELADRPVDQWDGCPICNERLNLVLPQAGQCPSCRRIYSAPLTRVAATNDEHPEVTDVRPHVLSSALYLKDVPTISILRPQDMHWQTKGQSPSVVPDGQLMDAIAKFGGAEIPDWAS